MKTVIIGKEIEPGFYEIVGFSEALIDPMATKRKKAKSIEGTEEEQILKNINDSLRENSAKTKKAMSLYMKFMKKNQKAAADSAMKEAVELKINRDYLIEALKAVYQEINIKMESSSEGPVYFRPKKGEILITDDVAQAMSMKKAKANEKQIFCIEINPECDKVISTKYIILPEENPGTLKE